MSRRGWIVLAALLVLLVGGSLLRDSLDIHWTTASVQEAVTGFGVWAPVIFVSMVAFRFLILLPSQLLLAAGGFLFGALPATLYGALGITLGALVKYAVVQWSGGARMRERIPPRYQHALVLARSRAGAGAVAVMTGYPVGAISLLHVAAAATGMAVLTFTVSVAAGSLVRSATYSYFGSALANGDHLLLGALAIAASATLPLLHPRPRSWLRQTLTRPPNE